MAEVNAKDKNDLALQQWKKIFEWDKEYNKRVLWGTH